MRAKTKDQEGVAGHRVEPTEGAARVADPRVVVARAREEWAVVGVAKGEVAMARAAEADRQDAREGARLEQ